MRAYERFLNYVKVNTMSDPEGAGIPSAEREFDLARMLVEEMKGLGIADARVDEHCYVYGTIPATPGMENVPKIGFIAHMDTAPDCSGENVNPQIIENYDGGDVVLGTSGKVLSVKAFPHLSSLKGRTLITTDGTTLLGADDKAGIAAIMTMVEEIQKEGTPHGTLCIAFTPDEEVGKGADLFDVEGFGADFAYTADGSQEYGIEYENFNGAGADVTIKGFSVHPGSSKDTMINALLVGMEFNNMLPSGDTPRDTEGYEGFYHLCHMHGDVAEAKMEYIVRDHSKSMYECRLETLRHIAKLLNEKYGEGTVTLEIEEQYRNMKEMIEPCMHLIDHAKAAMKEIGENPVEFPIRGGTDGARLSFMGLPCPNIGTGGYAYHGPYEHITVEGLDIAVKVYKGIVKKYSEAK